MAPVGVPSKAQRQQLNEAHSDEQDRERDGIVIEPMLTHDIHPMFRTPQFFGFQDRCTA